MTTVVNECPGCDTGHAVRMNDDYVTKDGVHLGPTYACDNPQCIFYFRGFSAQEAKP